MLNSKQIETFKRDGFVLIPALFSSDEVDTLINHFTELWETVSATQEYIDRKEKYPRMLQMHKWDELSLKWLLDDRFRQCLTDLLGTEPYAAQSMYYAKPPGTQGQALHQDQYYLRVKPGTCVAAWMALDRCDEENGCLHAVPGSGDLPVLCTEEADGNQSFTDVTVPIPPGLTAVPLIMEPGDLVFFNGSVIHGSGPNTSTTRSRRDLVAHYIAAEAEEMAEAYKPLLKMNGEGLEIGDARGGALCGELVTEDAGYSIEMRAI